MQGTGVTILVVEDEQLIRDMVADALSDGGFEAEVAVSGEDAVSLLQGNQTKYRALVTDIICSESSMAGKSAIAPGS